MAQIEPKTSMLSSVRHQRLAWKVILGEFIDNSFDAGASRVSIRFDKKTLQIEDDGNGCEDLLKMLTLGDRQQHAGTQLGRYGIGAKDASISVADCITIISRRNGVLRSATCNWKHLERSGSWTIEDPIEEPTADANGTQIILSSLLGSSKPEQAALVKALSLQYTPAIRSGRQIILQPNTKKPPVLVPEFRLPPLEHQITADLDIDGKLARVTMGIVPEGHVVDIGGVTVSYGYRVINSNTRLGLCDAPTPNLFGWVELGSGWELTKNKDNISSNLDALGRAIYSACKDTIDRAAKQATNVLFDGVAKDVNDALESLTLAGTDKTLKAKRAAATQRGTSKPTGTGSPHRRAARIQPGTTFGDGSNRTNGIRISFRSMGLDGPASCREAGVVYLNRDIPAIADKMNDRDALAVHAVYSAAAWIATDEGQQKRLMSLLEGKSVAQDIAVLTGCLLSKVHFTQKTELRIAN